MNKEKRKDKITRPLIEKSLAVRLQEFADQNAFCRGNLTIATNYIIDQALKGQKITNE